MIEKYEFYYISELNSGKILVIDGKNNRLIKELQAGIRPQSITVDKNNIIYIACDKSGKVILIDDDNTKEWKMPNNGFIEVDSIDEKIYVCNTDEVNVYNLLSGEKISVIKGFVAARDLMLNKISNTLIVLDIIKNEIKVFDLSDYKLIKTFNNIGIGPNSIALSDCGKYLYIGNKGSKRKEQSGNISLIDLENEDLSYIDLQIGSSINDIVCNNDYLYAANAGLNRIDIIDLKEKNNTQIIKTTLPIVKRLQFAKDKQTIFAFSTNFDNKYVLDKIDTSNNTILNTYTFEDSINPYDIEIITEYKKRIGDEDLKSKLHGEIKQKNGITVLAQKILSVYQEKLMFSDMSIRIGFDKVDSVGIEDIRFKKCEIVPDTLTRRIIKGDESYSMVEYDFFIPYYICCKKDHELIHGRVEGSQKAKLYIPYYEEQKGVKFTSNAFAQLINSPKIIGDILVFDLQVLIATYAIVEEMVCIPTLHN